MDNASKALIMAGAILIAVALVSLGVYLYQSAAGKVNDGTRQVDASQMLMLNQEIEKFKGRIKGSEANQLIRLVNAYNKQDVFPADLTIGGAHAPSGDTTNGYSDDYRDSTNYTISVTYDNDGWISSISVD